ncbi:MAG: hypothetical protein FJ308_18620 [Planctomycetes bacterium]|nr:hypothetical protein [Planctomycetota bacterium]
MLARIDRAVAAGRTSEISTGRLRKSMIAAGLLLASLSITGCTDPRWSQVEACCKLAHERNDPHEARKAFSILQQIEAENPSARCSSPWLGRGHSIEEVTELVRGTISAIESYNAIEIASIRLESEQQSLESE